MSAATTAAAAAAHSGAPSPARLALGRATLPLTVVLVVALFAFCHPYIGITGDATIYIMRALADLDPGGLGRDMMVVDDGQMRFSLFPLLLRPLVATLGPAKAAMLVAALGSAAWLAALAALAWRLAPGRTALAMVAMVAVLPLGYGEHGIFSFAETSATPRPLAEAAVMAGLAAILAGRPVAAALALAVATLLHPIMAAAGVGVAALVLLCRVLPLRRLAVAALVAAAIIAAAALALRGVPPFDRLVARPDAAWLALLRLRSPHLFPTLWTAESWSPLLAQAATILVAAHRAAPAPRRLFVATLVVCLGGLAVEAVLGDTLHLLLFIQTQAWRTTWLVGVLGGCALAFCTACLWPDGARGRVVLALLALVWFFQPTPWVTAAVAGLALLVEFDAFGARLRLADRHAIIAGLVAAILSVAWASLPILGYVAFLRGLPPGDASSLVDPLRNNLQSLPLCALIAAWLVAPAALAETAGVALVLALACLCLIVADVVEWDQRGAAQAYLESPHAPAGLAAMAAGRPAEVFWIDSHADAWFALRRPQYFSPQQAVSIVFSRPLAREWTRRANLLIELGLVPRHVFTPLSPAADGDRERITQVAVDALCARPDAPGLVIFPRDGGSPSLRDMIDWPLPAPLFEQKTFVSSDERRRIDGFGIVPCAPRAMPMPR